MIFGQSRWLRALSVLVAIGGGACQVTAQNAASPPQTVSLDWTVTSITTDAKTHRPVTHARLTLTNTGATPLPSGWTLYFTAIGDTVTANPATPVSHLAGSLYALTPQTELAPLAPGMALTFAIDHPGSVLRDDKGPTGPYLVPAGAAATPIAIHSFTHTGPRATTPGVPAALFSDPATDFRANAAWQNAATTDLPPVLPAPRTWRMAPGPGFTATLASPAPAPGLGIEVALARQLAAPTKRRTKQDATRLPLTLAVAPLSGETSAEAYRLTIDRHHGVAITGASAAGVFYGLQTLEQVVFRARQSDGSLLLHDTVIRDAPRFAWRGLLLDVARNFQPPAQIIATMDLMARFKLNRLHLHLSDDEGWRLAIASLPELTTVAARRGHSGPWQDRLPPAHGSGPDVTDPHGSGFYSGAEYIALLRAAQARHITVIPEFDLPGHARAAIKAMAVRAEAQPERGAAIRLDDPDDRSRYSSAQGFTDNAINPAMPGADHFVATLATEVRRLHRAAGVPLPILHIGGDEVPAGVWEGSPAAAAFAAKAGSNAPIKPLLWNTFFDRTLSTLRREGMAAMAWEELALMPGANGAEINPRFLGRDATIEIWNDFPGSEGLANRLANAGYKVVMAPAHALYFDMAQSADPAEPGHDWARILPLDAVWAFDPATGGASIPPLTAAGRQNLLGIEATLFSETVREPWRIDYMLIPRLLAMAERGWAPEPAWAAATDSAQATALRQSDWAVFARRLGEQTLPFVDTTFPALAYRLPRPGAVVEQGYIRANYPWPGVTLRYTTDGTVPTRHSLQVTDHVPAQGTITIAAFTSSGRSSPSLTIESHQ